MKRNYTCFLLKRRFIAYLCVGLVINCTPSARQRTYYEQLYADSAFITCEGDLNKPGVIDQQETAYMKAHQRMTRHLRYKDSLSWDFTAKELKISDDVSDYLTGCWKHENSLLRGDNPHIHGRFILKLVPTGHVLLPSREKCSRED